MSRNQLASIDSCFLSTRQWENPTKWTLHGRARTSRIQGLGLCRNWSTVAWEVYEGTAIIFQQKFRFTVDTVPVSA